MINYHEFKNGVVVVNTTPHELTMLDKGTDELVSVKSNPENIINATVKEVCISDIFVKTEFAGNIEGQNIIKSIEEWFNRHFDKTRTLVIVGSIIAAQAYPGKVFGLTPVPGYERVAPAEKRMSSDKFVTFA